MKISKMKHLKNQARKAIGEGISFVDVLERIYNKSRGQHNTAALLTAAKQHNALIITHTAKWAEQLREEHKVKATIYSDPAIWTFEGPVLMDLPTMFEFVKATSRNEKHLTALLDYLDLKGVD